VDDWGVGEDEAVGDSAEGGEGLGEEGLLGGECGCDCVCGGMGNFVG
jgi:hypothetical protein